MNTDKHGWDLIGCVAVPLLLNARECDASSRLVRQGCLLP